MSKNKKVWLSHWFNFGTLITLLLIVPSIVILLINLNNNSIPSYYGVSAANIPNSISSNRDQKQGSNNEKLSFQVMLPGVTLPISEIGYYLISLLVCSVVHEAGHAVAAIHEGNTLQI